MDKMEDDPPKSREAAKGKNSVKEEIFLSGVIEGFYNRPWTLHQRFVNFRNCMTTFNINKKYI